MTFIETVRYERNARLPAHDIRRLFTSVGWSDEAAVPLANLDRAFNYDTVTASAWDCDSLVGFVRGKVDGIYVFLTNLVVDPSYQHRGIGPQLFGMVVAEARAVPGVFAVVGLGAAGRLPFYARHGLFAVADVTLIADKPNV